MSKIERHAEVAELTEAIKASPTLFVTDFSGLNVLKMTEFRRRIRAAGGRYVVVKNTLAQRALAANSIVALDDHLTGNTGSGWAQCSFAASEFRFREEKSSFGAVSLVLMNKDGDTVGRVQKGQTLDIRGQCAGLDEVVRLDHCDLSR